MCWKDICCFLTHLCFDDFYSMTRTLQGGYSESSILLPPSVCCVFCFVCLFLLLCHSQCNNVCGGEEEGVKKFKNQMLYIYLEKLDLL